MKKQLALGVLAIVVMSSSAFAQRAAVETRRIQDQMREQVERAKKNSSLQGITATNAQRARTIISAEITKIADNKVSENEIRAAITRDLKFKDSAGSDVVVPGYEIGRTIVGAKAALQKINRNELKGEQLERLEATEKFLESTSQALALLSKTSEGKGAVDAATQLNITVLNKELSLTADTLTMTVAEINSRTKVMQKLVEKKTSPDMNGDVALAAAYKELYQDKAEAKKKELEGCGT